MKAKCNLLFITILLLLTSVQCRQGQTQDNDGEKVNAKVSPANALTKYLEKTDNSFSWELENTIERDQLRIYQLKLTSQRWRNLVWQHSLSIVVPQEIDNNRDGVLLFISGGNNKGANLHPDSDDEAVQAVEAIAKQNKAVTALIKQVPNQPLFGGKTEDEIISYTLHKYQNDGDFTWPLLFPMVKSVVKGMDAIQEFIKKQNGPPVNQFLLTGYSKRGWTTWLTGANDDRVKAIAPAVIDVLNMPFNVDYQLKTWGDYSVEIQDYVRLGIAQDINTESGQELVTMIDPFSYRNKLTMPKLILIGTNDPYWPVDAVKNYFNQLPGESYIFYTPNAGHDLNNGSKATPVLSEFFHEMLNGFDYPEWSYTYESTQEGLSLSIQSEQPFDYIEQWRAHSTDRDFRDDQWTVHKIGPKEVTRFTTTMPKTSKGYAASYWNVVYKGEVIPEYPLSTRMFVAGADSIYLEPMQ